MKCPSCKGSMGGVYEGEFVVCTTCDGDGRIGARDTFDWIVGTRWATFLEWLSFTRVGNRWWRQRRLPRVARALASNKTTFELWELHGRRLNRLREFATALEAGSDVGRWYRKETRLVAEAEMACNLKSVGTTEP